MQGINLTDAEWSVMDCLWERGALTGREAAELLRERFCDICVLPDLRGLDRVVEARLP